MRYSVGIFITLYMLFGCTPVTQQGDACDLIFGDVVISEVMNNPQTTPGFLSCDILCDDGCTTGKISCGGEGDCDYGCQDGWCLSSSGSDNEHEWFELYNARSTEVVLNRIQIERLSVVPLTKISDGAPSRRCSHQADCQPGLQCACVANCEGDTKACDTAQRPTFECTEKAASANICVVDSECNIGFICSAGSCERDFNQAGSLGVSCESTQHCAVGAICMFGICEAIEVGISDVGYDCKDDNDCSAGLLCFDLGRSNHAQRLLMTGPDLTCVRQMKVVDFHMLRAAGTVTAGGRFVVGDGPLEGDVQLDYSYRPQYNRAAVDENLGALGNTTGGLRLLCAGKEVDRVIWGSASARGLMATAGSSLAFDGGVAPDAMANDTDIHWCSSNTAYDANGNFGSPGAANGDCGYRFCEVPGGNSRSTIEPIVGQVMVSEVMANPDGTDRNAEWIEVVSTHGAVDLNGLRVTITSGTSSFTTVLEQQTCLPLEVGSPQVLVFIHEDDLMASPDLSAIDMGGVVPDIIVPVTRSNGFLLNGVATIELSRTGLLIDRAELPASVSGESWSLSPGYTLATDNDYSANFCRSEIPYGTGGGGTPGADNVCGVGPVLCDDNGVSRSVSSPMVGSVIITEFLADPGDTGAGSADNNREWIEMHNTGVVSVDINGLRLDQINSSGSTRSWDLKNIDCVSIQPGAYAIIGLEQSALDGAQPDMLISGSGFYNTAARFQLMLPQPQGGAILLDTTPELDGISGQSWNLSAAISAMSGAANDNPANWCAPLNAANGFVELGSPGIINEVCP